MHRLSDRHLLITIPKTVSWQTWLEEARHAEESGGWLYYHVCRGAFDLRRVADPCKVFVVHDGAVRGYHLMRAMDLLQQCRAFVCETTGRRWPEGWYLLRRGHFHPLERPVPYRGFRGVRYCQDFSQTQEMELP